MKHYANALWGIALLAISMLWLTTALALAPAGYEIRNQATVTYQDSLGNKYTAISNESVVTVAEIYGGELESNRSTTAAPGQTVYFSHQLVNKGNTDDQFTLSLANAAGSLTDLKVYLDTNGDGQPSSGEPQFQGSDPVPVARGGSVNLVVAASVPAGVKVGDVLSLTLTAAAVGRPVGATSADGNLTNTDQVTITDGAVLQVSKQVIRHDPATASKSGSVTYRIQIKNNGKDLTAGGLYDFFPDYVNLAGLNDQATADTRLGNIAITSAADLTSQLPSGITYIPENNNTNGLYVGITGLKSGASASLEFTVSYPVSTSPVLFAANEAMKDIAWVGYGDKSDNGTWSLASESNLTEVRLPQLLGISAANHDNSSQEEVVASAPAGGVAEFINTISNLGNGDDTFNLTVTNTDFPDGTKFTLWDQTGNFPLTDTNGDGIPDTGMLNSQLATSGNQIKIMIKAQLPGSATGAGPYLAVLTAVSVLDNSISDQVTEKLGTITPASIDLANYKATEDRIDFNGQVKNITDFFGENASKDFDPVENISSTISRKAGEPAQFGLYIANRSSISDSFGLSFRLGNSYSRATSLKEADTDCDDCHKDWGNTNYAVSLAKEVRARWQVTFRDAGIYDQTGNELAAPSGAVITSTPLLPAHTVMKVVATVELAGNLSDMPAGDYDIIFTAVAQTSGLQDSKTDRLSLLSESLLTFTPDAQGQVEAGNYIEYHHTLANTGNTTLNVALVTVASFSPPPGWSYSVRKQDGSPVTTSDTDSDYNLTPGEVATIIVRVTAEATLPPGSVFTLQLEAQGTIGATETVVATAAVTDITRVLSPSEARITTSKTVAPVFSGGLNGTFQEVLDTPVAPGNKVVWKVTATNTSVGIAENVIIYDQAPAFTRLAPAVPGNIPGNPIIDTKPAPANQVKVDGNNITFYIGDGADSGNTAKPGGSLPAGSTVEVTFEVEVEQ